MLVLFCAGRTFQDNRDIGMSLLAPCIQAFETVNDLVHAILGRYDADGKFRSIVWR